MPIYFLNGLSVIVKLKIGYEDFLLVYPPEDCASRENKTATGLFT
jgi:hypothetical protein